MSDLSDLAEAIDAMTLDELMSRTDLPEPGGDYDTMAGWADRVGVYVKNQGFRNMMDAMEDAGLATRVKGCVLRQGRPYRTELIHCPTLAKKIEDR